MIFIRSLLFNLWFFGITAVLGLYGIGLRLFARQRVLDLAMFWAGLVLGGARVLCGIEADVTGLQYLPEDGAALIASQHQSAFDTLIWLRLVPRACYVLKQELTRVPLFGPLLRPGGQIVVDRGAGAQALRSLLREGKRARNEARQIVIFPEGTRAKFGAMHPIQPGVVALSSHLGLPVVPVATDSGLRWGKAAFFKRPGPIRVAIMPPIPANTPKAELISLIRQRWLESGLDPSALEESVKPCG